ncbi:helix-turn-helix transcriptional regulator [Rhodococcus sp. IEGM 1379]|uniref:helix-turn-helix domain-containing protein n=1 Tax=Rhodococcus sp. IEGM 1379 TaxID=3047086 RepID=UPI0024B66D39|nr:helix-turn-helix transcriptional regulator [Rhodococcus sp. IEGM 1379]MDI9915068.1 helix-turn-helix transcriptional regulator [Rhodococcus sp. IEGM 1379]
MSGFSEWVKNQLELRPYGDIQDAARALKIRPSELSRWLASKRPPTQDTMRVASRVFDVPILEILIAAEYLTVEEAGLDPRSSTTATLSTPELSRPGAD